MDNENEKNLTTGIVSTPYGIIFAVHTARSLVNAQAAEHCCKTLGLLFQTA